MSKTRYFVHRGEFLGTSQQIGVIGFESRSKAEKEARRLAKKTRKPHMVVSKRALTIYGPRRKR